MTRPFNFHKWVDENRHLLKPPVGNTCLLRTDGYFVMVVGGPNERADFHCQVQGSMFLRIVMDGVFRELEIQEGELYLLPANTLHSPKRLPDTVGVVLERTREEPGRFQKLTRDHLYWFCPNAAAHGDTPVELHHAEFASKDLFTELPRLLNVWKNDASLRLCKACGYQADALEAPRGLPL